MKFNFIWDNIKARGSLTKSITLHGSGFVLAHIDSSDAMLWLEPWPVRQDLDNAEGVR